MWTGEKSESGRGVWGCVPNLFFFFFFPQNPADVDGDQLDVSKDPSGSKMLEKKFFSRTRESPLGNFESIGKFFFLSARFVVNRIVFHSLVMWCARSCSKSSGFFFSRARDSFLWLSETVFFCGNKTGGRVRNLGDFFFRARAIVFFGN